MGQSRIFSTKHGVIKATIVKYRKKGLSLFGRKIIEGGLAEGVRVVMPSGRVILVKESGVNLKKMSVAQFTKAIEKLLPNCDMRGE